MIRYATLLSILAVSQLLIAQENLVPNGSFEMCMPNSGNEVGYFGASGWYNPNAGTSDFYSDVEANPTCFLTNVNVSLGEDPQGLTAFEGNQFVGMYAYHPLFCLRELIQCKLTEPLQANVKYCVGFYVRTSFQMNNATDGIGIQLSTDSVVDFNSTCVLPLSASIQSPSGNPLMTTDSWTYVSGDYLASGGEVYLTLGNVMADEDLTIGQLTGTTINESAYYFYDDVSVINCDIANSISEEQLEFNLFPNPAHNVLNIQSKGAIDVIRIFAVDGRLTEEIQSPQGQSISLSSYAPGTYFIQLISADGTQATKSFQVE